MSGFEMRPTTNSKIRKLQFCWKAAKMFTIYCRHSRLVCSCSHCHHLRIRSVADLGRHRVPRVSAPKTKDEHPEHQGPVPGVPRVGSLQPPTPVETGTHKSGNLQKWRKSEKETGKSEEKSEKELCKSGEKLGRNLQKNINLAKSFPKRESRRS